MDSSTSQELHPLLTASHVRTEIDFLRITMDEENHKNVILVSITISVSMMVSNFCCLDEQLAFFT